MAIKIDSKFLAKMINGSARYLTCGHDLIYVAKDGSEFFELGDWTIPFQVLDLPELRDYLFALQMFVEELPKNSATYEWAARHSKWLVSAAVNDSSKGSVDAYLSAEFLITGHLDNDSRVLAAHLDALVSAGDAFRKNK